MKFRPLQDRVLVKRVDTEEKLLVALFCLIHKKSRWKVKSLLLVVAINQMMAQCGHLMSNLGTVFFSENGLVPRLKLMAMTFLS